MLSFIPNFRYQKKRLCNSETLFMFWNNKLNFKTFWLDAGFPNLFERVLNYWNLTTTVVRFDISLGKTSIKRIIKLRVL